MEKYNLKWTGDWDTDNATVEAFNQKSAAAQSQFDEANAKAHDRNAGLPAAANGYTPSGSSTLLNQLNYLMVMRVVKRLVTLLKVVQHCLLKVQMVSLGCI